MKIFGTIYTFHLSQRKIIIKPQSDWSKPNFGYFHWLGRKKEIKKNELEKKHKNQQPNRSKYNNKDNNKTIRNYNKLQENNREYRNLVSCSIRLIEYFINFLRKFIKSGRK
mgnify:CR=1 FL=1